MTELAKSCAKVEENLARGFVGVPYKLAYKSLVYGPCEKNALSQEGLIEKGV
jgi:hypothetical protein